MDRKAWVHQLKKQIDKFGEKDAPWYVSWYDPEGKRRTKSCGTGKIGFTAATKLADTTHSQLVTGTYETCRKKTWDQFFARYKDHVENRYDERSRKAALLSIKTFVRIAKPHYMKSINTDKVDEFIGIRRKETVENKKRGTTRAVSPATVNRELRYLKASLRLASDWGFVSKMPRIRYLKPAEKLPTYVTPEHFAAMIEACKVATMPEDVPNVPAVEWWRGLLVMLYMTGWRIGQTLAIRWEDVDLDAGTAITLADHNKGRRDQETPLHPLIVKFLRPLAGSFSPTVFPWNRNERTLWAEFERIQRAATLADGSPMPKSGKNGGWYGFHDLRRGFATANAASMNLLELKDLMQHKSLSTTQGYINMANTLNKAVSTLFVPELRVSETA